MRRVVTEGDSFTGETPSAQSPLRIPQARVLQVLLPRPEQHPTEWPLLSRKVIARRMGCSMKSGSVTRALNGQLSGKSGPPQVGLIAQGYVEVVEVDVDGVAEVNYRITPAGVAAYQAFLAAGKKIPSPRKGTVNNRYKK
jgi:hypothetical protein